MLGCLFGSSGRVEGSLPFKMASKEYEVARLKPAKPCGILLMGRSGTGKTSVQCYRLAFEWQDYWRATLVDGEPRLAVDPPPEPAAPDDGDDDGPYAEDPMAAAGLAARAAADTPTPTIFGHLRQLFVTKSMVLRSEVQRVSRDLMRGSRVGAPVADAKGVEGLRTLRTVQPDRYPLFATMPELLALLDRSLPGGPFVSGGARGGDGNAGGNGAGGLSGLGGGGSAGGGGELSGLEAYFDDHGFDDDGPGGYGGGGEEGGEGDLDVADLDRLDVEETRLEMNWLVFMRKVWPKLLKKGIEVEASLLWTEINSNLKGSVEALKVLARYQRPGSLPRRMGALKEVYDALGRKQSAIDPAKRDAIWDLFTQYENIRRKHHYFDQSDFVANLYRRARRFGPCGVFFHKMYIDEVQDFTMAELFLLFQFSDPNESFLAGDTAQTIARGVSFRFADLKTLFNKMHDARRGTAVAIRTPDPYSLVTSYRSHVGVLRLASSVVEVLYRYFPRAIDNLGLDKGLFDGPKPKLLLVDDIPELTVMLLGHQRIATGRIDFGSEQVILVRDDAARKSIPPSLAESAIILTIFEAKGSKHPA
jgi:uncharacterized membrane protein YgcG